MRSPIIAGSVRNCDRIPFSIKNDYGRKIRPQIIHYSFPLPVSIIRQNCLIFCEQNIVIYYGQQLEDRTDRESSVNLDYDQSLD